MLSEASLWVVFCILSFSWVYTFSFFSSIYSIFIFSPSGFGYAVIFQFSTWILVFSCSSSCGSLPLYVVLPVSSAKLAPQYFTFLRLKSHCHPLQGLRNFISFTFNYRFYAHGLLQPPSCPSFLPCALSPVPFSSPWLQNHFLAIIADRWKSVVYLLIYILKKYIYF